jgi:hypothetical protein|tara:strand:- start:1674 stop:1943 length:270 start_codon:yes stop_codon:yes gene_type:complete
MEYRDKKTDKMSTSATSSQSPAIAEGIMVVRIITTVDSHYAIGVNPTATDSDAFIPAKSEFFVGISSGEKVAVRTVTGGGTAFITSLTR